MMAITTSSSISVKPRRSFLIMGMVLVAGGRAVRDGRGPPEVGSYRPGAGVAGPLVAARRGTAARSFRLQVEVEGRRAVLRDGDAQGRLGVVARRDRLLAQRGEAAGHLLRERLVAGGVDA